jgi:hypothetical protein
MKQSSLLVSLDCFAPLAMTRRVRMERELSHHQHVEDDHRRQAKDHRPDADRPKNVCGGEALLFRKLIIPGIHDAPAFLAFVGPLIPVEF